MNDCRRGMATIRGDTMYPDQSQFSFGHCYIKYATNGSGEQLVSGQTILDTINAIFEDCGTFYGTWVGSFGTNNCDACNVTVNYRACTFPKKDPWDRDLD